MRVGELVREAGVVARALHGDPATTLGSITHDSRTVEPGALFCCLPGEHTDGHDHAPAAVAAGAAALLVSHRLDLDVVQIEVDDTRAAMARLAAAFHGFPSRRLTVVGVTGTNGKTTTTYVLASIFEAHGWPTTIIGTLSAARTTPEATDLQAQLADCVASGGRAVAMEVSSHALAQHRVDATRFSLAIFTNLSRDHLDYHGTMERYFAAKALLFEPELADRAVVCADDVHGRLLVDAARVPTTTYSLADAHHLVVGPTWSQFDWHGRRCILPLGGRFNAQNALGAATAALELGIGLDAIVHGLATVRVVPGRFERIDEGQPFSVIVDYAHTPDGLAQVLDAAREVAGTGRVLVVFGCGGDRDRTKRPAMGSAATEGADVAIVTSDNPRSEDPLAIIEEVRQGAGPEATLLVEPARRDAIALALRSAHGGDVVVIAGKGHETTQAIGDLVLPFDDRQVAREELRRLGWSGDRS